MILAQSPTLVAREPGFGLARAQDSYSLFDKAARCARRHNQSNYRNRLTLQSPSGHRLQRECRATECVAFDARVGKEPVQRNFLYCERLEQLRDFFPIVHDASPLELGNHQRTTSGCETSKVSSGCENNSRNLYGRVQPLLIRCLSQQSFCSFQQTPNDRHHHDHGHRNCRPSSYPIESHVASEDYCPRCGVIESSCVCFLLVSEVAR